MLDKMQEQGQNKAVGFIGPFDAVMRCGVSPGMAAGYVRPLLTFDFVTCAA